MAELDRILFNLVEPMTEHPEDLEVTQEQGGRKNEIILRVIADNSDVARLIGRKGMMASALRQVMSVASHKDNKRVVIKFVQREKQADEDNTEA